MSENIGITATIRKVHSSVWVPLASAMAFMVIFALVYNLLNIGDLASFIPIPDQTSIKATPPEHLWKKLLYGVSLISLLTILIWNVVVHVSIRNRHKPAFANKTTLMVNRAIVMSSFILIAIIGSAGFGGKLADAFVSQLPSAVQSVVQLMNLLTALVIWLAISCSCMLAHPISGIQDRIQMIKQRTKLFLLSIYSLSALLVVGVIEIHFLLAWSSSIATSTGLVDAATTKPLVNAMTISAGICFSMLLIIIYLPTGFFLNRLQYGIEAEVIEHEGVDFSIEAWRARYNLPQLAVDIRTNLAALAMPIVTGIFPALFA